MEADTASTTAHEDLETGCLGSLLSQWWSSAEQGSSCSTYQEASDEALIDKFNLPKTTDLDEWGRRFPISKLPPLPARSDKYTTEAINGFCFVSGICLCFTLIVYSSVGEPEIWKDPSWCRSALDTTLVWVAATMACTLCIIFGRSGEIKRSKSACYPIPPKVVQNLLEPHNSTDMDENVSGPLGHSKLGSYCVRCFVWRPPEDSAGWKSHHCSICQRCFTGFDHHCSVYGRCIVRGNTPCFAANFGMLLIGIFTVVMTLGRCDG